MKKESIWSLKRDWQDQNIKKSRVDNVQKEDNSFLILFEHKQDIIMKRRKTIIITTNLMKAEMYVHGQGQGEEYNWAKNSV